MTLRIRWLGTVPYREAFDLQDGLRRGEQDHLLLLEHPHVYTQGIRGDQGHLLVDPASVGADLVQSNRGGDITYHGPGQLVGYPILTVPGRRGGGLADTAAYVESIEQLLIDVLADLGLAATRVPRCPGVWVDDGAGPPRKIAAIGVRIVKGRSMHGFALNVAPDMAMFGHIVPCGIADKGVTSLAEEGIDVDMRAVVDAVAARAAQRWGSGTPGAERSDVVWRARLDDADLTPFSRGEGPGETAGRASSHLAPIDAMATDAPVTVSGRMRARMDEAGVGAGTSDRDRKPEWVRATVRHTPEVRDLERTMRDLDLVTVCEEAGCPNRSECWSDGTATFMVGGERCTRKCGFCLVDTRKPAPLDPGEPTRVAEAVARMGLRFAVLTMVARDDLDDGAAAHVAATIDAIRDRNPGCGVEALISDLRGDAASLATVVDARPDVLNHNVETVPRLQRVVRPSASYPRSLAVLARAKAAGLATKTSIIVGMGETDDEVDATLADLAGIGVDIVTIGQYLRPTSNHLPVARWVAPDAYPRWKRLGESLGLAHVEASPLTRSSYHAREAADAASRSVPVALSRR